MFHVKNSSASTSTFGKSKIAKPNLNVWPSCLLNCQQTDLILLDFS